MSNVKGIIESLEWEVRAEKWELDVMHRIHLAVRDAELNQLRKREELIETIKTLVTKEDKNE